jgi:hypothetical protein
VVASLLCYSDSNGDQVRGRGVFERSITALQVGPVLLLYLSTHSNMNNRYSNARSMWLPVCPVIATAMWTSKEEEASLNAASQHCR